MKMEKLSVFFPAYSEEKNIESTVETAIRVLKELEVGHEIIIVDDGSTDKTGEIADQLARKYPQVRVVHQENGGYGVALQTGFSQGRYPWIAYTDADGQFDFSQISKFLEAGRFADAVWGYRLNRQDNLSRVIIGKLWLFSTKLLLGIDLHDVNCGFKLIKKSAMEKILPLQSRRGGMINVELAYKIKKTGLILAEVPVAHYPRKAGQASGASLAVAICSYLDLFSFWLKTRKRQ